MDDDTADDLQAPSPQPPVSQPPSPRQIARAATRATKESLIAQAELTAMTAPPAQAPAQMRALLDQWKQAGRTTKAEDDALWERFNQAQDQLFTRLDLLREQRQEAMAAAKQAKESLIATAEAVATRADVRQAAETMTALLAQWKLVGPAPDDKDLWTRFKAAQDQVFRRRSETRRQAESEQREAAAAKRAIIAEAQGLVGAPDLRLANADLRRLGEAFRETGYAGRDLNKTLGDEFHQAQQDFYAWVHHEPARRRDAGEQPAYGRRARLVQQIEDTRAEIARAEQTLRSADSSGAKRSHGTSITLTLGQSGGYSNAAAEAMRARLRLTDLESQLTRLDSTLSRTADPQQ